MPRLYDVLYTREQDNPNNRGNQMIERKEILQTLMSIDDINELKLIKSALIDRIAEVSSRIKYTLRIGDEVIVTTNTGYNNNTKEYGTIKKVNRTRAVVDIEHKGYYNVPFSMITKRGGSV